MSQNPLNAKGMEAAYAAYEATGISYDAMGITAAIHAYLASQEAAAPSEALAHIVTDPNGKRRVTLADKYDPMASAFWVGGEMPEGYAVTPLFASPAPVAPVAVSVKRLEWTEVSEGGIWEVSNVANAWYTIVERMTNDGYLQTWNEGRAVTLNEAKRAAQADFNARILSSIIPATKGGEDAIRRSAIEDVLGLLTGHELYRYRPKAFNGFIEYARTELAALSAQDTDGVAKP